MEIGRTSSSARVFDAYSKVHELAVSYRTEINQFPEALQCFTGLPHPLGVSMLPLKNLRCFSETAQSWKPEAHGLTDGCTGVMKKRKNFAYQMCNIEYVFTVAECLDY